MLPVGRLSAQFSASAAGSRASPPGWSLAARNTSTQAHSKSGVRKRGKSIEQAVEKAPVENGSAQRSTKIKSEQKPSKKGPVNFVSLKLHGGASTKNKSYRRSSREGVLSRYKVVETEEGRSYVPITPQVPQKVKAAIHRAQSVLEKQGRVLSKEAFEAEVRLRLSSMYPYTGTVKWWQSAYQEIYAASLDGQDQTWEIPLRFQYAQQAVEKIGKEGMEAFKRDWESLHQGCKAANWPAIALWLLRESPDKLADFILATHSYPYPPFSLVTDCLLYIRFFHNHLAQKETYRSAVTTCMGPDRWPVISAAQRGVRLYVMTAGFEKASEAFEELKKRETLLPCATLLCFMNVFTQAAEVDKAIECLRMIQALDTDGTLINSNDVARHCTRLLMLDSVVEEEGERNFRILPQVLKLGVKPTRIMMNVILRNSFGTGDPHLGLDMLKYMKDQGMEFDSYTHLELLQDAVSRLDRDRTAMLIQEVQSNEELRNNKILSSKIIHAQFVFGTKDLSARAGSTGVFVEMLQRYSRHYDPSPLKDLGMIPPEYENTAAEDDYPPPPPVLFLMMAAYIRNQGDASKPFSLYRRWIKLAEEGHPVIAPTVAFPQFFNEFILPFRLPGSDLRDCLSLMEDMLEPASDHVTTAKGARIKRARPNVWTWNTLMSVFNAARQPDAVNMIREMMQKHNVKYDQVTWTTIIWGSVKMQDMMAAALAVQKMESAGFVANSHTMRALRDSKDPELLSSALESVDADAQQFAEWEERVLEQEKEELLDKGLQRLAGAIQAEKTGQAGQLETAGQT